MRRSVVVAALAVAAAVVPTPTAASAWTSDWWHSPTGNIRCRYWPDIGGVPVMACMTRNDNFVVAVPMTGGKAWKDPGGAPGWGRWPAGPVLRYGETWKVDREFKCWSQKKGVTCRSLARNHGFFINRTHYRLW